MMHRDKLTVGELKRRLAGFDDDATVEFAGGLTLYRIRSVAADAVFVEFNEAQADLTPAFRRRNPQIGVAFIATEAIEWNPAGTIGSVNATVE